MHIVITALALSLVLSVAGATAATAAETASDAVDTAPQESTFLHGGDPARGAEMAKLCISCHGHQGRSVTSRYPSLAGMDETRIVEGMKSLRAGEKGHMMANMTRGLSDQDIADLAAYFSSLDP
ncbi:c-type cytochrome [Billgrantia montanilacus]|nr:c-type cytochrome [Halomonas montanilacus]